MPSALSALSAYRRIFAEAPGSLAFSAAGFIARMPMSMMGIGMVTMLSSLRGDYALGGAVSATIALAAALLGPQVARLVDRYGQSRIALRATGVTVAAMGALLLCAAFGAPDWTLFVCAAVVGCMPAVGSLVRARWANLYQGSPLLHTAYSFESVVDEIVFIVGPILAVGLSTSWFPEAGPLSALILLAVGTLMFCAQGRTEPPVHPHTHATAAGSALRTRGLLVLVLTFVGVGAVFGSVEVVTVAFADHLHHKALSSVVLAIYALGSCVAGIVFGALHLKGPLSRRFLVGIVTLGLSMLPLLFVKNLVALAVALFVAGLSISPTMVTTMALVERIVPTAKLTEGMTWTTTGLAVGVAFGSSAAGWTVDAAGASSGYWVTVAAAGLSVAAAFLGSRRLRSAPEQRERARVESDDPAEPVEQLGR
ncbi:MFS transporter [Streptacidiphilus neutrinimicus]|uniref:MFS transporter n=1 Tax=Streptacidiphilus neutrinimicus TaxID=105420 RepID=UPI000B125F93|nr:MFS transporter [Streptacidiphilus neutrinimicus]